MLHPAIAKAALFLALCISFAALPLQCAEAAEGQGPLSVSVEHPTMEILAGHQEAQWITIRNNGSAPVDVSLYLSGDYKRSAWVDQTQVSIPPHQVARINMTVYALDEVRPGTYTLQIYANAPLINLSASCTVLVIVKQQPASDGIEAPWYLLLLLLIPLAAGIVTYRVMKRMERVFKVFEVFLVCNDGRLIRHFPQGTDRSDDISKSALFSAIQDFIKEAFDYEGERGGGNLREIVFGDIRVYVERGANIYVAVVTKGDAPADLRKRLLDILASIEERFGDLLEEWDGDLSPFEDIAQISLEDLSISYVGPKVKRKHKKA